MECESIAFSQLFSIPQRNGLTKPKRVRGSGLPMVNMGELFAYPRIANVEMDLVPVSDGERQFLLQPGDLLFARQSLVLEGAGQCSIFIENSKPTVFESHIIRCRLDKRLADPNFYYYFFRSRSGRSVVEQIVEQGAGASGIRGSDLAEIEVPHPPIQLQREVVSVLSAFDDRIENLRQTNATLEAIAQALFKSWFVDFDPVRAKAEGREPEGMDPATAALFPSEFEDSELGPIPKGWERSTLGKVCDQMGGVIQTGPFGSQLHASDYRPMGVPVVMPQDLSGRKVSEGRIARIAESDAERLSRHRLKSGDIVFSRRGDVGRHALVSEQEVGWLCGTGCLLVRPGDTESISMFVSATLAYPDSVEWLVRHAVGATMPNLNTKILSALPLLWPATDVVREFEAVASPLDHLVSVNLVQVQTLAQLRDTLLSRLITGNPRFPDAAATIEEAVA